MPPPVTILHLAPLEKMLAELPTNVQKKVMRTAIRKGGRVVANRIKQIAAAKPHGEGETPRKVKVKSLPRSRVSFGVAAGVFDSPSILPTEYGHKAGSVELGGQRTEVEPSPIVRPAWEQTREAVSRQIIAATKAGIIREASKARR